MSEKGKGKGISRREFVGTAATAAAGLTILPSSVIAGSGQPAPSDRLNIAGVGVGGYGRTNLKNMASENIVALCDVDWKYAQACFEDYPDAKSYRDWRRMFDEMHASIDAVVIATADHTHASVAAHAMTLGKHVYVQKPLTHSVYESRLLTKLAREYKVATQMGNQGSSGEGIRQAGALYDLIPADPQNTRPAGEWNSVEIKVYKGSVWHYQNGEVVLEYRLWTPEWNELVASSKFPKLNPDWADVAAEGLIGLQDHGDNVWYRNIKIKELETGS